MTRRDYDAVSLSREPERKRLADAATSPGNENNLSLGRVHG
jgi:hypothetical protein